MKKYKTELPTGLFDFLLKSAPNKVFISLFLGVLAGLAYALIIPLVTQSIDISPSNVLQPESEEKFYIGNFEISHTKYAIAFFLLCIFILITRTVSSTILQQVATNAAMELRIHIYGRISRLPIMDLERIGPSQLYASIANDVPKITLGATFLPAIMINVATIVGLLGFLVYLNSNVFFFVIGTILFGIITYRLPFFLGGRYFANARKKLDDIQEGIRGLIYGAKELKLNHRMQHAFMEEELIANEAIHRDQHVKGNILMVAAVNYGNLISFFAIGIAVFVINNHYGITPETLISVVMAMLYITGPLSGILGSINPVVQGNVGLRKLGSLLNDMPEEEFSSLPEVVSFERIELRSVRHSYRSLDDHGFGFELGPISLTMRKGEVTFLVGGNGSGKTTLGKILSLYYVPQEGGVYFDDQLSTEANINNYRQNISAIFSDFYLFTNLHGIDTDELENLASHYLKYFSLEDKVRIENGRFSTTELSTGQRKRLALLVAYLENRDVYIFDEWAADQDPRFKDIFYHKILSGLKANGKLVIVISHDDRYFHLADRIVRMENGKVVNEKSAATLAAI